MGAGMIRCQVAASPLPGSHGKGEAGQPISHHGFNAMALGMMRVLTSAKASAQPAAPGQRCHSTKDWQWPWSSNGCDKLEVRPIVAGIRRGSADRAFVIVGAGQAQCARCPAIQAQSNRTDIKWTIAENWTDDCANVVICRRVVLAQDLICSGNVAEVVKGFNQEIAIAVSGATCAAPLSQKKTLLIARANETSKLAFGADSRVTTRLLRLRLPRLPTISAAVSTGFEGPSPTSGSTTVLPPRPELRIP